MDAFFCQAKENAHQTVDITSNKQIQETVTIVIAKQKLSSKAGLLVASVVKSEVDAAIYFNRTSKQEYTSVCCIVLVYIHSVYIQLAMKKLDS